jgi:hypothetical protein
VHASAILQVIRRNQRGELWWILRLVPHGLGLLMRCLSLPLYLSWAVFFLARCVVLLLVPGTFIFNHESFLENLFMTSQLSHPPNPTSYRAVDLGAILGYA